MEYTIQQTQGIKTKMFSIYQEGVEWIRSLSLVKAKKIVEALTTSTVMTNNEGEKHESVTPYQYSSRSNDVSCENSPQSARLDSSSCDDQTEVRSLSVADDQTSGACLQGDGRDLCGTTGTDGEVSQDSKLAEFQRLVSRVNESFEQHHELVLEQGQLVNVS